MGQLLRRRILVVEDEAAIALDLADLVREEGAVPVGPVATVDEALRVIGISPIDCAVVDIDLFGEESWAVAEALGNAKVPYLFLSGYSTERVPPRYRLRPFLEKPYQAGRLIAAITALTRLPN